MKKAIDSKRVTNDVTVQTFSHTSTSIGGTADGLKRSLKELEDDIKKDEAGKKVGALTRIGAKALRPNLKGLRGARVH
jgi:hypothetical protein